MTVQAGGTIHRYRLVLPKHVYGLPPPARFKRVRADKPPGCSVERVNGPNLERMDIDASEAPE
jgi:hypothetical protein